MNSYTERLKMLRAEISTDINHKTSHSFNPLDSLMKSLLETSPLKEFQESLRSIKTKEEYETILDSLSSEELPDAYDKASDIIEVTNDGVMIFGFEPVSSEEILKVSEVAFKKIFNNKLENISTPINEIKSSIDELNKKPKGIWTRIDWINSVALPLLIGALFFTLGKESKSNKEVIMQKESSIAQEKDRQRSFVINNPDPKFTKMVIPKELEVRYSRSEFSQVLGKLRQRELVKELETGGDGWTLIKQIHNNIELALEGWVLSKHLQDLPALTND